MNSTSATTSSPSASASPFTVNDCGTDQLPVVKLRVAGSTVILPTPAFSSAAATVTGAVGAEARRTMIAAPAASPSATASVAGATASAAASSSVTVTAMPGALTPP